MLRRIGFRRLLPVVNLAFYLLVVCFSPRSFNQGADGESTKPVRIPTRVKVVMSLNVPVMAPVSLLTEKIAPTFSVTWLSLLLGIFIPIWWYFVGRWFDRRLGWAVRLKPRRTPVRDVLLITSTVVAALPILLFFQTFFLSAAHRHAHASTTGIEVGLCGWYCFLLVVLADMLRTRYFHKDRMRDLGTGEDTSNV
jgi:hypothetical protein